MEHILPTNVKCCKSTDTSCPLPLAGVFLHIQVAIILSNVILLLCAFASELYAEGHPSDLRSVLVCP
jgi:hypothetical protein